ncbi:MAG: DUF3311 domain-containing protein [candidate division NC10 bacterium]|nr:DUF3311 domain-containing protein [candidate division NC10 bacterium]
MQNHRMKIAILLGLINFLGAIWPVTWLVNRIEPFVLGFPFFLFWTTLWIFVCFLNLAISYQLVERKGGEKP